MASQPLNFIVLSKEKAGFLKIQPRSFDQLGPRSKGGVAWLIRVKVCTEDLKMGHSTVVESVFIEKTLHLSALLLSTRPIVPFTDNQQHPLCPLLLFLQHRPNNLNVPMICVLRTSMLLSDGVEIQQRHRCLRHKMACRRAQNFHIFVARRAFCTSQSHNQKQLSSLLKQHTSYTA